MKRKILAGLFSIGIAVTGVALTGTAAEAKIKPVPISCTNNGGHQAPGQQPECKGGGQTQESENQNPAGHAPPGHN